MPPPTVASLLIIIAAVLPGAMYTWGFERQVGSFGISLADKTLRFIAVSVLFHLVLGWPEYILYRIWFASHRLDAGQFAAIWGTALLLTIVPAGIGSVLGRLYITRNSRVGVHGIRRRRLLKILLGNERAPRAWDSLFSERPAIYIRLRTADGTWLAGRFADRSYAAGYPNETDLYLEEAWSVNSDTTLGTIGLGYSLYIPADQIAWMEVITQRTT